MQLQRHTALGGGRHPVRRRVGRRGRRRAFRLFWWGLGPVGVLGGCSPQDLVNGARLPSNVPDPAALQTPAGALATYRGTLVAFRDAVGGYVHGAAPGDGSFIVVSGLLADELQSGNIGEPLGTVEDQTQLDSRVLPELPEYQGLGNGENLRARPYALLQEVRKQVAEARGLLRQYRPDSSRALVGHLFAVEGYSELMLAELYCSGIPLSTVDYGGDYTLKPGSSTTEVLQHALALFDSALALSGDSARVVHLARVGQARALLDLGQLAAAAAAATLVPDDFRYQLNYTTPNVNARAQNFAYVDPNGWPVTVADSEGRTGLDYRTSGDPRTASSFTRTNNYGQALYHPDHYAPAGDTPIVLASGVEARLIGAEAALAAHDPVAWLTTLNTLRQSTAGLAPLSDPGSDTARVSLLFRERAFWLFLTGHRQGDLRRLIRQYQRDLDAVYPSGPYPGGATGRYGSDVTVPVPAQERVYNAKFTGCLNRGA